MLKVIKFLKGAGQVIKGVVKPLPGTGIIKVFKDAKQGQLDAKLKAAGYIVGIVVVGFLLFKGIISFEEVERLIGLLLGSPTV